MRKGVIKSLFLFGMMLLWGGILMPTAEARTARTSSTDVKVKSYTKKNGTRVEGHYRSKKDSSVVNNYSCIDKGNCKKSGKKSGKKTSVKTPKTPKTSKKSGKKRR